MRNLIPAIFLIFFVSITKYGFAQIKSTALQGHVINESLTAAEAATVVLLLQRDSSFYRSTSTDKNGLFKFSAIKPQAYIIMVTKVGAKTFYSKPYHISANNITIVDTIRLTPSAVNLSEVIVTDKRKYIEIRPDKTILNIDRNILANGVSAFNILSNAPGVRINSGGVVSLRGNQQASIAINGKLLRLNDADMATYLQNLQSDNIDQIELVQNPSAKDDNMGNGGFINIILKKGKNEGFNGSATVTGGDGNYHLYNTAFSGNYRTRKVNIFGNIGYNYRYTDHTINTLREVYSTNPILLDTRYYNNQKSPVVSFGIGTDFNIDSAHTIGFLIKGSSDNSKFDKNTSTYKSINAIPDSNFTTLSNLKRSVDIINYNINYAGKIGRTNQTLSADADMGIYNRHNNEDIFSSAKQAIVKSLSPLKASLINGNDTLKNIAPTRYTNNTLKVDYTNPISKGILFEAGIKGAYIKNDNSQNFSYLTDNGFEPISDLTSQFIYKEKTGIAYINFTQTLSRFNYHAGLRVQRTNVNANVATYGIGYQRNYMQYFPMVQFNYQADKASLITLDYNRTAELPGMESLNSTIAYQDNYNYTVGNPYLKPAYSNLVQLTYTLNDKYNIAGFYQTTSNFWHFSYFYQNPANSILITTRLNIKRMNYYGIKSSLPVDITSWWNANLYAEFSYYHFKDDVLKLDKGGKDIIFNLNQDFSIKKNWKLNVSGNYESPSYFGLSSLREVYYVNAGISKSFLNRTASLSLAAEDIFNTRRDSYMTMFSNIDISGYDKRSTRIVRLSFTYRFGKKTVKAARRHITGNDDEQKRVGN
ncbi:TonB-dependent receptor [Mucilaginibacter sp. KACC 22063]|uniref:TonB-dependent receptor n=1 Tax=Mucilaginibacter sp. KACC 22063 TaxID=3025666 RepID=UPI0023668EC1|nr:TonB-dependent receptor [Mucilaginibacter sp. KACC 22063]WDF56588.1 TonB-dependent receptor [Mucilaginibacter sp. KACC 22063]